MCRVNQSMARLVDGVARVAVVADLLPIARPVVVVGTAETAGKIDVTDVVGVGPNPDTHVRKHVSMSDVLNRKNGAVDLASARRCGLQLRGPVKVAQLA